MFTENSRSPIRSHACAAQIERLHQVIDGITMEKGYGAPQWQMLENRWPQPSKLDFHKQQGAFMTSQLQTVAMIKAAVRRHKREAGDQLAALNVIRPARRN